MVAEETLDVASLVESEISVQSNQCKVCRWLDTRDADEADKWSAVMKDRARYPHAAIHRAIIKADPGAKFGRGSVEGHRVNRHRQ